MAFHNKVNALTSLSPDLAIIPECAETQKFFSKTKAPSLLPVDWVGHNRDKGLGVYAKRGSTLHRHESYSPAFSHFLPIVVGESSPFHLLAVWAFNHRAPDDTSGYAYQAIEHYEHFLRERPSVIAGDFNNSVVWDRPCAANNFKTLSNRLAEFDLISAYHIHSGDSFGNETATTYYYRRGADSYHIDYCFIPNSWKIRSVRVEPKEQWIKLSDHVPLIVDMNRSFVKKTPLSDVPRVEA